MLALLSGNVNVDRDSNILARTGCTAVCSSTDMNINSYERYRDIEYLLFKNNLITMINNSVIIVF